MRRSSPRHSAKLGAMADGTMLTGKKVAGVAFGFPSFANIPHQR